MWIIEHWAFVSWVIVAILSAVAAYWRVDKRLALSEQNLKSAVEKLESALKRMEDSRQSTVDSIKASMDEKFKNVRDDISRLEKKQDKYNTLQERTLRVEIEQKQQHDRITALENIARKN